MISVIVERNDDLLSGAIRDNNGKVLMQAGDHDKHWRAKIREGSTPTHAQVPIFRNDQPWATVELRFTELGDGGLLGLWRNPLIRLLIFMAAAGFAAYFLFMKRTLQHLDPSSVIPERVRQTLDILSEGVVLVDRDERIVLANEAFSGIVDTTSDEMLGTPLSRYEWRSNAPDSQGPTPWLEAAEEGQLRSRVPLARTDSSGEPRLFMVNTAPILDDAGKPRGALATFDDVTDLEKKTEELEHTVRKLQASEQEVRRQNDRLHILAHHDPLTNCFNRRALFEKLEEEHRIAHDSDGGSLCCIMSDIDHFKSINDRFGHQIGDKVLQAVADALRAGLRPGDVVARYGGEEFCILLPDTDLNTAVMVAERLRANIEADVTTEVQTAEELRVTSSFGVADLQDVEIMDDIIQHADEALYASKHGGRNRVTQWVDLQQVAAEAV